MDTPFLAVDLARLRSTIAATQAFADARGLNLRPHVKTHKCLEIARMQVEAGARGITVATIGEAEVFADGGFDDLFIAYPLWPTDAARERLRALADRASVLIGVDSVEAASGWVGTGVRALIEVDSGHHRSGVHPAAAGVVAAGAVASGLAIEGVFTFPGHSYAPGEPRLQAGADEASALALAADAMRAQGVEPRVISGGSTPSLAATGSGLTETRPGVYVFNDAQQWELGSCGPDDIALTCHATVVSQAGGRIVLDAGSKALGADRPAWTSGFGRLLDFPDARIVMLSEHHAVVDMPDPHLPLGAGVRVVPNHACNAVALADTLEIVENGRRVGTWSVAARGRNS